ncbi:MAG TPA: hypothetical protein VLF89_02935 [Candidatus Saccharimonadales bacterium]|nr:hypothetical protein [Candidatus Saccharimonadales bacterium]
MNTIKRISVAYALEPHFAQYWTIIESDGDSYQFSPKGTNKQLKKRSDFLWVLEQYLKKEFRDHGYTSQDYKISITSMVTACFLQSIRNAEEMYKLQSE